MFLIKVHLLAKKKKFCTVYELRFQICEKSFLDLLLFTDVSLTSVSRINIFIRTIFINSVL